MKNLFLKTYLLFIFINTYGQNKIDTGIYWSEDKLSSITLLKNNQFGYTSFHGTSPYLYKEKRKKENYKRKMCGTIHFSVNEQGTGTYSINKNNLLLNFIKTSHAVDSISFKKTKKQTKEISIKLKIKSYFYRETFDNFIGIGTDIKSKDGTIDLNTQFENYIVFNLNRNQIPMEITINNNYSFIIKKKYSQEITLFYNDFKMMSTGDIDNKIYDLKKLTKEGTKNNLQQPFNISPSL